ncbi:MAG: phytanoyl-CoA dioxygenase family protein [Pseudonocardiaceae bacterium]
MSLSDSDLDRLRTDGYTLVPDFLDAATLERCHAELARYFPTGAELAAAPDRYRGLRKSAGFPYDGDTLNQVCTDPRIISFTARVLGRDDIRLGDSILQAKYGPALGAGNDQRLHNDAWGRNTLVHPGDDPIYQRVFGIVYYTDVTAETGPTWVVPHRYARDVPLLSDEGYSAYDRAEFPELYEAAQPVEAPAGALLLFTGKTVHRGSAVTAPTAHRFALFLNFHSAAATWLDKQSWAGSPASPTGPALRRFVESATPRQRELLGFPPPGAPYWTDLTIAGLRQLYPGMDISPYATATAA